jgi:hypothetical protein
VLKQEPLDMDATAEAGQRAVRADHPMARQDERQRVPPVRRADCSRSRAAKPEPPCLLAVAHRLSVGDRCEGEPAAALEVGPVQFEGEVEHHAIAVEIFVKLTRGVRKHRRAPLRADAPAVKEHPLQAGFGRYEPEWADRTVNYRTRHLVNLERVGDAFCETAVMADNASERRI